MKKKIIVSGPVLSRSGYGEMARFALRALKQHEDKFDIYTIPLNWGQTSWIYEDNEERRWIDSLINKTVMFLQQKDNQFDLYIHVGIPPEFKKKAPISISVNASIETDRVQAEWIDVLNRECDKVITISEHSKAVLENTKYSYIKNEMVLFTNNTDTYKAKNKGNGRHNRRIRYKQGLSY